MTISPEEIMTRMGVFTPLWAADDGVICGAVNDKECGRFFAIDRESGNFRWRLDSPAGWAVAAPLIWGDFCIAGTSVADMNRSEEGGQFATVNWRRGGAVLAIEIQSGEVRFLDLRCGVVRETPRAEGDTLVVSGEIRVGGFRDDEPWSASTEVESRFDLPSGRLIGRRAKGALRPEDFPGEPAPELLE
ncbi:MAG: hypothetical protein HOJ95_06035 [Nitrospinaceae bacterium]|nr:hypothetical protein [Nitrospinaceae bacterium]MBT3434168.1 hypothetical protein [Nitrospinaceae bacterium]MBT3821160.1 hypothetical protein [Nitrospinaceae bacterium]MBT4094059.1 hypothetical protein [Nitrospinaceae bacterium]MBT5369886.1 hypothetical protein [Nitrospinaceae bacterium]